MGAALATARGVRAADPIPVPVDAEVTSVTVSTGGDNGFLKCVMQKWPTAKTHDSSQALGGSLESMVNNSRALMVIGHGDGGKICTGLGESCLLYPAYLLYHLDGKEPWRTYLEPLKARQLTEIRVLGCNTGAGDRGRDLLKELAELLNCSVKAPVGLVFCDQGSVWLEINAAGDDAWQTLQPPGGGPVPTPIQKPMRPAPATPNATFFVNGAQIEDVRTNFSVQVLDLTPALLRTDLTQPEKKLQDRARKAFRQAMKSLPAPSPASLIPLIDFSQPKVTTAVPAALEVARLKLRVTPRNGHAFDKTLIILNSVIAMDEEPKVGGELPTRVYYYFLRGFPDLGPP